MDIKRDDTLVELLGFPSIEAFENMGELIKRITLTIGEEKILKINPNSAEILVPDVYVNRDFDGYLYHVLCSLSQAFTCTQALYDANNIQYDPERLPAEKLIQSLIPSQNSEVKNKITGLLSEIFDPTSGSKLALEAERTGADLTKLKDSLDEAFSKTFKDRTESPLALKIKEDGLDLTELDTFCTGAVERIIEAIETCFYLIKDYDSDKPSQGWNEKIDETVEKISKYAEIGLMLVPILEGYNLITKAGTVRSVMELMRNKDRIITWIKNEDTYRFFNPLLQVHAELNNLPYSGAFWAFGDLIGEEITLSMDLVRFYRREFDLYTDAILLGKGRTVVPVTPDGLIRTLDLEQVKDFKAMTFEGLTDLAFLAILYSERLGETINFSKAPFIFLDERAHALGMPFQQARKLQDYLAFNYLDRSPFGKKCDIVPKQLSAELKKPSKDYPAYVAYAVEKATGKKPNKVAYRFFQEDDVKLSDAIGQWIIIAKKTGDKIEMLLESSHLKLPLDAIARDYGNIYGKEGEVYIGYNQGVCFVFRYDPFGMLINPEFSVIESYEDNNSQEYLEQIIRRLEVDAHEFVHAAQVGSPLAWRSVAASVLDYVCTEAIKEQEKGRLEYSTHNFTYRTLTGKKRTNREELVRLVDIYGALCLGNDWIAGKMREEGALEALHNANLEIFGEDGDINVKQFEEVLLEKSQTSIHLKEVRKALHEGDLASLRNLKPIIVDYSQELSIIIETMANAYSLIVVRDFLKDYPDARYKQETLNHVYDSVRSDLARVGRLAEKYFEVAKERTFASDDELNAELEKHGLVHQRIIIKSHNNTRERLSQLGYNLFDPFSAYEEIDRLRQKANQNKIELKELLLPMNAANALLRQRYNSSIPLFMDVIKKYGEHDAFKLLLEAESLEYIKDLLK